MQMTFASQLASQLPPLLGCLTGGPSPVEGYALSLQSSLALLDVAGRGCLMLA